MGLNKIKTKAALLMTGVNSLLKAGLSRGSSAINKVTTYTRKSVNDSKSIPVGHAKSVTAALYDMPGRINNTFSMKMVTGGVNWAMNSRAGLTAQALVGASGMTAISMMSGAVSRAQDIAASRYMRDSRYSGKMMAMTQIGSSAGSRLSIGNHTGLSLALSKGRHG